LSCAKQLTEYRKSHLEILCYSIKFGYLSGFPVILIFGGFWSLLKLHDVRGNICLTDVMTHSKFLLLNITLFSFISVLRGRLIKIKKYFCLKLKAEPENILNFFIKLFGTAREVLSKVLHGNQL